LDTTPIDGEMMDIMRLGELGREGVLMLMCESTNAERPGYTPSEKKVGASLESIFASHSKKRIIIATFSSNVHRVQQIIDTSAHHGRKVAITGRSMLNIVSAATELGYMTIPSGVLVDINEIKPMTRNDYQVGGCTALLDAIGGAIHHIGNVHKYARPEDVPARTMFIITTDGEENASRKYSSSEIKSLIKECEESGWEFLFVADNIDAVETASSIGIRADRAAQYDVSHDTPCMFASMSKTVKLYRKSGTVRDNWATDIRADKNKK
jgi:hypothetical protein